MSSQVLPRTVSVRRAAQAGSELRGDVDLASMPRVAAAVLGANSPLEVSLVFGESDTGKRTVRASVDGVVQLECQRCLQPVDVALAARSFLTVVAHDEEAKARIRDVDPLIVPGDELDVIGLLEEEILLALPIVALHDTDCTAAMPGVGSPGSAQGVKGGTVAEHVGPGSAQQPGASSGPATADLASQGGSRKPFAVLGELKRSLRDNGKPG